MITRRLVVFCIGYMTFLPVVGQSNDYYAVQNLKNLEKQGKRHHAPCIIFIDEKGQEKPTASAIEALTRDFNENLNAQFPCIVSSSVLYNLVFRKQNINDTQHPENKKVVDSLEKLTDDTWKIYKLGESKFFLLLPTWYLTSYKSDEESGLLLSKLRPLTGVLPTNARNPDFTVLINYLENDESKNKNKPASIVSALEQAFTQKRYQHQEVIQDKAPIWDCIIEGHGSLQTSIAGVSPGTMQTILLFFNNKVTAGVVTIVSCNAGGQNLSLLQWREKDVALTFNYILIVSSITDAPITKKLTEQFLKDYFLNAALIDSKGGLEKLLKDLVPEEQRTSNRMFLNQLPQVWLPGGIGFQTLKISDYIEIIGLVTNRVHELEDKPFIIKNRHAILIYPDAIKVPMVVEPTDVISLKREGTWTEFVIGDPQREYFSKRYPAFISMIPGHAIHYFEDIRVKPLFDNQSEQSILTRPLAIIDLAKRYMGSGKRGILRFITDSFILPTLQRATQKIMLIDTLTGHNDLTEVIHKIGHCRVKQD